MIGESVSLTRHLSTGMESSEALFPYLRNKQIGFMSWGTLDRGIITGPGHPAQSF